MSRRLQRISRWINKASDAYDADERIALDYVLCALYEVLAELEEREGEDA